MLLVLANTPEVAPPRQGSGVQNVYHTVTCTVRKTFAALPRVNRLHPHDKSRQKTNKGDPIVWVHAWKFPGFGAPPAPNSAAYVAKDRYSQRILDVAREIAAAQVVVLQQRDADARKTVKDSDREL